MLGGGDKGAAGALVLAEDKDKLKQAVEIAYPRSRPAFADRFAVHTCKVVEGITVLQERL
jgi:galactokinase